MASSVSAASAAAAMAPFAHALEAFFAGDDGASVIIRRDDGLEVPLPARHFFRTEAELSAIDRHALDECRGRVLDAGAGAGVHSLLLQARGLAVTALDVSPPLIEIMRRRGVRDVVCADIRTWSGGPFDTMLLLGHGTGIVGERAALEAFLAHVHGLLAPGGCILLDSTDVTRTDDPRHLAYQEANRRAGRYPGEIRMGFEHAGEVGPFGPWLHVDSATLGRAARAAGFSPEILIEEVTGEYLARLAC